MKFLPTLVTRLIVQAEQHQVKIDLSTSLEKEMFLTGYRLGCPVEGDSIPSEVDQDDPNFRRGYETGRADFEALPETIKREGKVLHS